MRKPFLYGLGMPGDLVAHNLRIGLFRFTIAPEQSLEVPAFNKGNMLRGGFGHAFRRLCCVPQCKDTKTCPLAASCPYKAVFEPSPPPDADRLSKNQDIPRPFVFRAPHTQQTRFEQGQLFEFVLVLIGRALDFLPHFVLSFRELAAEGLGLNRAKCNLERVEQIKPCPGGAEDCQTEVVFAAEDQLFRATEAMTTGEWIKAAPTIPLPAGALGGVQRLTVRFLTPTFLRADGAVIHRPEFHHLFKRLRDRINALSTFFGDGPLHADFSELGKRAEVVKTVSCDVTWSERFRTSSKTRQRHELSGFVGEAIYEGDLAEFLHWLLLGELVHVGKHAAWGNGRIEVNQ
jgi:CRISPR/Cas system endoribonuclease Cas6 (RAMP superfamily)